MKLACILLFFVTSYHFQLYGQADKVTDSIIQKMYWYALQHPSSKLFVHFDKNIYTNSENVWLTGYMLKRDTNDNHNTLSVAVIRNDDWSVLTTSKFVMNHDFAFGSFYLPDSLPIGNYSFVCYTNQLVNGYPAALFVQPITIKTANVAGFVANLSLLDSITPNMDSATALLKAYTADVSLMKGVAVNYFIGDRSHPFKSGTIKTDKFGEARISIPLKQISAANNVLQTEIDNGKEVKTFSVKLPVYKKEAVVKFYPEGGNLVNGASNTVAWEALDNEGEPLMVRAGLYKNNVLLQTIETNAYGVGKFAVTPQQEDHFYVKLLTTEFAGDQQYKLPVALDNAPVVSITNSLVEDTLSVRLTNNTKQSKWVVMIHNYRSAFVIAPVVTHQQTTTIKIALQDVPKGLNTFTLLDELARPCAERLFFAHFDKKPLVNITTDSASYLPRQKVELKFKITDAQQNPLKSLVSIACVQANRIDIKKMNDIETYVYLKSELADLPFKNKMLGNDEDSKEYLENILLVKGWRKYTWQDLATAKAADTIQQKSSLAYKGITLINNKPLKKPVQLNLRKFIAQKISTLAYLNTDSTGRFNLAQENIISEPDRQVQLTVNSKAHDQYMIRVTDPYKEINRKLAATILFSNYEVKSFAQSSQSFVLQKEEGGKRLLDVKVVAKSFNNIFAAPLRGRNMCGDYVCGAGILNCKNHPFDEYQPVVGKTYGFRYGGSNRIDQIVYEGCSQLVENTNKEFLFAMDGVYSKKEFYVNDLTKTDASDPQYLSTLYWNHSLLTNDKGEGQATFYTGDIPGKFRIIIQGITNKNVVYGEQSFEVKKQ